MVVKRFASVRRPRGQLLECPLGGAYEANEIAQKLLGRFFKQFDLPGPGPANNINEIHFPLAYIVLLGGYGQTALAISQRLARDPPISCL